MGVSPREFSFLQLAHRQGMFAPGGSILEFGESCTDQRDPKQAIDVAQAIGGLMAVGEERNKALAQAQILKSDSLEAARYAEARLIYQVVFKYKSYTSIDLQPATDHHIQQDLNVPFDLGLQFDICINNGTTEHVFNQANCYKAIHDHTRAGGLMIHWTPCLGWINHGLYNVQPGFFPDLARANSYEICLAALGTDSNLYNLFALNEALLAAHSDMRDSLVMVVMRKTSDVAFRPPLQAFYSHLAPYVRT
jgi:hypothetical protein